MITMGKILVAEQDGVSVLKFVGDVRATLGPTIAGYVNSIGFDKRVRSIVIDLTEADCIDSTALGFLAKISLRSQEVLDAVPTIVSSNDDITRIILSMGFDQVFVIVSERDCDSDTLGEMPTQLVTEEALCDQVLEAHRVLMSLNQKNENMFKDLVVALELERAGHISPPSLRAVR